MLTLPHCFLSTSFHNKLKTNPKYLNHKVNRRCDDLIQVLLLYEQDMFCERMRKEVMMSPTHASKKLEGQNRHAAAIHIADSSVQVIIPFLASILYLCIICIKYEQEFGPSKWMVMSSDGKNCYTINVEHCTCSLQPSCIPQCTSDGCGYLCRHQLNCSCVDYANGHLCTHVHKVHMMQTLVNPTLKPSQRDNTTLDTPKSAKHHNPGKMAIQLG